MIILGELKRVGKRQKEKEKEAQEENKKTAETGAREGAASPRCADKSEARGPWCVRRRWGGTRRPQANSHLLKNLVIIFHSLMS